MVKNYTGRDEADATRRNYAGRGDVEGEDNEKRPVENEVAAWWEPDGMEDENDEGGGDETKWGAEAGAEAGADEQGRDPVDSSSGRRWSRAPGCAQQGGGEGSVRRGGGDGSAKRCGGYGQARGARDADGAVSDAADGSCYGDTEVWARLLVESSGDIWARTRAGANVARWGGRSDRGAEAAAGTRWGSSGRVNAKRKWVQGDACGKRDGGGGRCGGEVGTGHKWMYCGVVVKQTSVLRRSSASDKRKPRLADATNTVQVNGNMRANKRVTWTNGMWDREGERRVGSSQVSTTVGEPALLPMNAERIQSAHGGYRDVRGGKPREVLVKRGQKDMGKDMEGGNDKNEAISTEEEDRTRNAIIKCSELGLPVL
ncbi:hypothetical protein B0H14DRAFT_2588049 [Mycena olivaceomarginata]|nr:hypothetical protein B0H14DRAFT_2588049 [Mycena olivaceomarginata]